MRVEYRTEPEYIEYLDGEAHPKVSPRIRHGAVQARLAMFLQQMAPSPHIIATEGDAAVNNDEARRTKLIPDISFYWPDRFKGLTYDEQDEPAFSRDCHRSSIPRGQAIVLEPKDRTLFCNERFTNPFPWFTFELRELFIVLDPIPDWME